MVIAIWVIAFLALAAFLGFCYQAIGTRRDARRFPTPGRLVDVSTHRLHLLESGEGTPTIVLEAGLMSTILSWTELQKELAKSHRVVSYDRAGLGWSDLGPMPRTAQRIVDELHELLQSAAIAPPYILVGHSFGGLIMPLFSARFPAEVAGVVLVDPVVPAEWNPPSEKDRKLTSVAAKVCRRAAVLARVGVIRFVAFLLTTGAKTIGARLVRLISKGTPGDSGTVSSPWFAALPPEERAMAAVFWIQPKFALTIASQLENLPTSAASVAGAGVYSSSPVCILSARTAPEHRRNEHAAMAARLPAGEHILAEGSNHWIMQEQPELVLQAVERIASNWRPSKAQMDFPASSPRPEAKAVPSK